MELIVKDRNGNILIEGAQLNGNFKTIIISQENEGIADVIMLDKKSIDKLIESLNKIKNIL